MSNLSGQNMVERTETALLDHPKETPVTPLRQDIAVYQAMQADLESEHLGRWALVCDGKLIDVFDGFEAAAQRAITDFGRGPYLIRQIGAPPVVLPASVMYRPLHADHMRI